jgi:hypothetical protein
MSLARKDLKALLRALLTQRGGPGVPADFDSFLSHQLGGGYSGSYVAIVWLDPLPTLIMKAGPADQILRETESRRHFASRALDDIRALGLEDCSEPVEVEADGHDDMWRAMAYAYVGSLSYDDLSRFSDFQAIFEDFVAPARMDLRPPAPALRDWLRRLCEQVTQGEPAAGGRGPARGVRAKPLGEYLPRLPWSRGLEAVIESAAAFAPQESALHGFRDWWEGAVSRESIAQFPNSARLHGDLRFANVLVDRTTATVELIDFGNSAQGHVFSDLARFECDLLFRVLPPPIQTETLRLSSEDRRIRTLERAFSPRPGALDDPVDRDNPQLAALRLLRETYDSFWHLNSNEGRHKMYLWFLLAEVMKRLMWTGDESSTSDVRRALLCAIPMLKQATAGEDAEAAGFSPVSEISRLLGCTAMYVPSYGYEAAVNRERNAAKIDALREAKNSRTTVRLLAETGNSFLHFRGQFYPEIESLLESGRLEVVIANPYFVESHGISAAYKDSSKLDEAGLHSLLKQKFAESFTGYESLRTQAGPRITARVARYGIGATLLMTDAEIFFEPYFRSDRSHRHRRIFDTFEFRFSARNDHLRQLFSEHFAFHWANSDAFGEESRFRDRYLPVLENLGELWQGGA